MHVSNRFWILVTALAAIGLGFFATFTQQDRTGPNFRARTTESSNDAAAAGSAEPAEKHEVVGLPDR